MTPCIHSLLEQARTRARASRQGDERTFDSCSALQPVSAAIEAGLSPEEALSKFTPRYRDEHNRPLIGFEEQPGHLSALVKYDIPFIIDMHCHFFPPVVQKLIWRWFDKVGWPVAYRGNPTERVSELRRNGIHYFTTLLYAHRPDMAEGLNEWIARSHKEWPGAIAFGTFFPEPGVLEYVQRAVEEDGLRGFKLHVEVSELELVDERLRPVFDYLSRQAIPVVIHSGTAPVPGQFSGVEHFRPLMQRHPDAHVIVAHMGATEINDYLDLLADYEHLSLDTSMVFVDFLATGDSLPESEILSRVNGASERIYFGTDFPSIPYNISHAALRLLECTELDRTAKQNLFYKNAARRFSIPTESV